jgi:hypothetical protein
MCPSEIAEALRLRVFVTTGPPPHPAWWSPYLLPSSPIKKGLGWIELRLAPCGRVYYTVIFFDRLRSLSYFRFQHLEHGVGGTAHDIMGLVAKSKMDG